MVIVAVARAPSGPAGRRRGRPRRPAAGRGSGCRSPSGTGCRRRCPGGSPGWGRGTPRRASAGRSYEMTAGSKTTRTASVWPVRPAADLFVRGVRGVAALVADQGGPDALGLPELALGAPEAAQAEVGDLQALRVGAEQRVAEDGVAVGDGEGRARGGPQGLLGGGEVGRDGGRTACGSAPRAGERRGTDWQQCLCRRGGAGFRPAPTPPPEAAEPPGSRPRAGRSAAAASPGCRRSPRSPPPPARGRPRTPRPGLRP